jgi:hypothetical protein
MRLTSRLEKNKHYAEENNGLGHAKGFSFSCIMKKI